MKKIIVCCGFLFCCISIYAQNPDLARDNSKAPGLRSLIDFSTANVSKLSNLEKLGYTMVDTDDDFVAYRFTQYNDFLVERFVKDKRISITFIYVEAIYNGYIKDAIKLKFKKKSTNVSEDGVENIYSNGKTEITIRKFIEDGSRKLMMELVIESSK